MSIIGIPTTTMDCFAIKKLLSYLSLDTPIYFTPILCIFCPPLMILDIQWGRHIGILFFFAWGGGLPYHPHILHLQVAKGVGSREGWEYFLLLSKNFLVSSSSGFPTPLVQSIKFCFLKAMASSPISLWP